MKRYLILLGVLLCFLQGSKAQELANGNVVQVAGTGNQVQCANDGTTGTTINLLAKAVTTGCIKAAITDTNLPVWIVTSATATTGSAALTMAGEAACIMDTTTASGALGDYVIASVTTAGQCHHQSAQPTTAFVIGTLMSDATTSGSTATILVVSTFTGGSGKGTMFALNTTGGTNTVAASTTTYQGFGGVSNAFSTAAAREFTVAAACTASNLRVKTTGTQNAGGSLVVSLYDVTGAAATTLVATVTAGGTVGWYRDTTHTVALVAENEYALQVVNNYAGGASTGVVEYVMQCN